MLYLYSNITPNYANGRHYLFSDFDDYQTELASNLIEQITIDNYRINSNVIKCSLDAVLTAGNFDTVTYAIVVEGDFKRCYIVNQATMQSGFATYDCSVDLWASYIYRATLSNIHVVRCNRNIGTGIYDPIPLTNLATVSYLPITNITSGTDNQLFDLEKVGILFSLNYNYKQTNFGAVTESGMYCIKVAELKRYFIAKGYLPSGTLINAIDLALEVVSGIYGVDSTLITNAASVLGAWLVDYQMILGEPSDIIPISTSTIRQDAKIKTETVSGTTYENIVKAIPSMMWRNFTVTTDASNDMYVGTKYCGLKLNNSTVSQNVVYNYIVSQSDLKVIVNVGELQQDITDAFKVELTTNSGDVTSLRAITWGVSNIVNIMANTARSIGGVKGGTVGAPDINTFEDTNANQINALTSGGSYIINSIGMLNSLQTYSGNQIGRGDGLTTFRHETSSAPAKNPYAITTYASLIDVPTRTRYAGVKFDNYVSSLASIFTYSLLGSGTFTDTYIEAYAIVDNIPTTAANEIKRKLQGGINLVNLD